MPGVDELIENRIQEAMAAGAFRNLRGEGRPLPFRPEDALAGDRWLGFKVLRNSDALPEWLELAREIERDTEALRSIDAEHEALAQHAAASGRWRETAPLIAACRRAYAEAARALRRKQDRFNIEAPGHLSQRPGIWVEEQLRRLDHRVREACRRDDPASAAPA